MATVSSRFRKNLGAGNRIWTDALRFCRPPPLSAWLYPQFDFGFWILDLFQSEIQNLKSIWQGRRDSNPQSPAWKTGGLANLPTSSDARGKIWTFTWAMFKTAASAVGLHALIKRMVLAAGFEPATFGFWNRCLLPNWATRAQRFAIFDWIRN